MSNVSFYLGAVLRDSTFQSSAYGKRENVDTTIDGRVMFDMLPYMFRNHKLSSYSLNSVSAELLGQQKEDVHYSIISDLQVQGLMRAWCLCHKLSSYDTRRVILSFCTQHTSPRFCVGGRWEAFLPQFQHVVDPQPSLHLTLDFCHSASGPLYIPFHATRTVQTKTADDSRCTASRTRSCL